MVWSTPRTWVALEVPTALIMNADIRDNLLAIDSRIDIDGTLADGGLLVGGALGLIRALAVAAKGVIYVGDATTDPSAHAIGANKTIYMADSGEVTGVKSSSVTRAVVELPFRISGKDGGVITTGQKGRLEIPFDMTITGWTILADVSGSIVVDVAKDTYANFPPAFPGDSIAGSEKPTLSSAQRNQDLTLSTWTTRVTAGDILAYNVDSITTCTEVRVIIRGDKT